MGKTRSWIPFAGFLAACGLIFSAIHFFHAAETPPWRSTSQASDPSSETSASKNSSDKSRQQPFRFLAYNVRNWLVSTQTPIKSPESKAAIIRIISTASPDIVGLCEIGSTADVAEIQAHLKQAGLDLPHTYYTGGVDQVRHLAILSRFPITSHESPPIAIEGGNDFSMQRGILDVTIHIHDEPVRFIGLHLKSKRTVPQFDQALLRAEEARHVRKYIDSILTKNTSTKLLLYGDVNDQIRSPSTRSILGTYRSPAYLTLIPLKDSRGESWTHFFKEQDSYSRIDIVAVSSALRPHINRNESFIVDSSDWFKASDHRALLVSFK